MITQKLIQKRINNWWGYGSFEAPVWFVGIEEGLADTTEPELEDRLQSTKTDEKKLTDIRGEEMRNIPTHMKFFLGENPPLQSLWKYYIRLYLYLKNSVVPKENKVREYQKNRFANPSLKETSCLDLMPLPSRGANASCWVYSKYNINNLESRSKYIQAYRPVRIAKLKNLINNYQPKLVVFGSASKEYLKLWEDVIGIKAQRITRRTLFARNADTVFLIIPNGGQSGLSYEELDNLVDRIRKEVSLNDHLAFK